MLLVVAKEWRLQTLLGVGGSFWFSLGAKGQPRLDPDVVGDGVDHLMIKKKTKYSPKSKLGIIDFTHLLADGKGALLQIRDVGHSAEILDLLAQTALGLAGDGLANLLSNALLLVRRRRQDGLDGAGGELNARECVMVIDKCLKFVANASLVF
jgi:hypothetical protein